MAVHVIIAGCGRVGSAVARVLAEQGHDVAIIDKDPRAFRRLRPDFSGETFVGVVFDRPTLEAAGIKRAQGFVAVTSGDNSNVVSARTAKDVYGVAHVVARIYDPERANIYERLGINTIASARWTSEAVLQVLLPEGDRVEGSVGTGGGDVVLVTVTVPANVRGAEARQLTVPGQSVLVAVTREGNTHLPVASALLEGNDQVHLALPRDDAGNARRLVERLAESHS